jgi:DNA-binding MarR family transcriptional regulator
MLDRNSDVSRLVDRLLKQGLVTREEDAQNRRKVIVKITDSGLKLLGDLQPLIDEMNRSIAQIPEEQLAQVNAVLDQIRTIYDCKEIPQCGENT